MKIEQEIMEMFRKKFPFTIIDWKVETNGEEKAINKTEEIKSFISHIITLVQERQKEEMVERIEKERKKCRWSTAKGRVDFEIGLERAINLIKQND